MKELRARLMSVGPESFAGYALGASAVLLFLAWARADGGFFPTVWLPGGVFLLALLVAGVIGIRGVGASPRPLVVAALLLAAFAGWSALSIMWADVQGAAWDGANRTAVYATVFALFALWPWRTTTVATLLGLFAVGTAAVVTAEFLAAASSDDPQRFFIDGRFSEPAGYQNANAALVLIAFFPALVLAARREIPALLRGLFTACAALLLQLGLIAQSRASLVAFPAAALGYFALTPSRTRTLVTGAIVAGATAAAASPLLDVYTADGARERLDALAQARTAMGATCAAALVAGTLVALVDMRVAVPRAVSTALGRVGLAAAGIALLAGAIAAIVFAGAVVERTGNAWDEFKTGEPKFEESGTHFTSGLGTDRYDMWRVALEEFAESPLHGIGAENFATAYIRERDSDIEPRYAHSLELQVLAQTGGVGAALFGGFLIVALVAAVRAVLRSRGFVGALAAAAVGSFVYWLAHASVDWLWEFPALTAPALAALALAARLAPAPRAIADADGRRRRLVARVAAVLALFAATVTTASYVFPWLAAKEVQRASRTWRVDAPSAFERLERARRLNPLSDSADRLAGAIASRRGEWGRMRSSFARAAERNPNSWYAQLELAVAASMEGDRAAAATALDRAAALNPREPTIRLVRSRLGSRRPVTPAELDREFVRRLEERTK